jgi:hypothetical protein
MPTGTAFFIGRTGYDGLIVKTSLNVARVEKGVMRVVRKVGEKHEIYALTFPDGKKILFPNEWEKGKSSAIGYRLVSLPDGRELPRPITKIPKATVSVYSVSSQDRYVAIGWVADDSPASAPSPKIRGFGVLNRITGHNWRQEGTSVFGAWSVSGLQFVFARWLVQGAYYDGDPHQEGSPLRPFRQRTPAKRLKDTHFFTVDVRDIAKGTPTPVRRILQAEATRLVGGWYVPAVLTALKENNPYFTYGNSIAPGNRGVLFVNYRDKNYDPNMPLFPSALSLEWTIQFIDARGRSYLYRPSPALYPFAWSRDGERVYCRAGDISRRDDQDALVCFWVRTGKYVEIPVPDELGQVQGFIED